MEREAIEQAATAGLPERAGVNPRFAISDPGADRLAGHRAIVIDREGHDDVVAVRWSPARRARLGRWRIRLVDRCLGSDGCRRARRHEQREDQESPDPHARSLRQASQRPAARFRIKSRSAIVVCQLRMVSDA